MLNWLPILGPIINGVTSYFTHKQQMAAEKQKTELAVAEARTKSALKMAEAGQMAEIDWDVQAQKNAETSWKDEYWVLILSIPMIMCFIPGMDVFVYAGFRSLENTPDWYQYALLVAIAASFGFRQLANWRGNGSNKDS